MTKKPTLVGGDLGGRFGQRTTGRLRARAGVAQLAERQPSKLHVASSNLVSRSKPDPRFGRSRPFATIRRMVKGDWPELESLVIRTGVRVLRANEAAASVSAAVQEFNEANSALHEQPTAADVSTLAERYATQVAPLESAATTIETEMVEIASGQTRIFEIIEDEHGATGVAEEYLGGAVDLGAQAAFLAEELARFSRSVAEPGRTYPPVEDATASLAFAMRRVVVALEPAVGWGARSAAILADWT